MVHQVKFSKAIGLPLQMGIILEVSLQI